MIQANCCCGTTGNVLLWETGSMAPGLSYANMLQIYVDMGLIIQIDGLATDISPFGLIFLSLPIADPPWWEQIANLKWTGRLVITGEWGPTFNDAINFINSKAGITGMSLNSDLFDEGCGQIGSVTADPLCAGQDTILYGATSTVNGGTVLSRTATGAHPWMSHNKKTGDGKIDFVLCGDTNHLANDCPLSQTLHNKPFIQNLWNVGL